MTGMGIFAAIIVGVCCVVALIYKMFGSQIDKMKYKSDMKTKYKKLTVRQKREIHSILTGLEKGRMRTAARNNGTLTMNANEAMDSTIDEMAWLIEKEKFEKAHGIKILDWYIKLDIEYLSKQI